MPSLYQVSQNARRFTQHYNSSDSLSGSIVGLFYGLSGRYLDAILNEKAPSLLIARLQQLNYQFGLFSHNGFAEPIYHRALFAHFKLPKTKSNLEAIEKWKNWIGKRSDKAFFSYLDLQLPAGIDYAQQSKNLDWQFNDIWQTLEQQGLAQSTPTVVADPNHEISQAYLDLALKVSTELYWQGSVIPSEIMIREVK
ncbi:putative sulfatase [Glaesserella parasuis str. Nagasaki]|uniref:hypothetical protein n=1 Tax=Glaesserella parasuis TaxID=738 RepID=UPI00043606A1|nr:hypothetical protein [Glaesserella parasuis]EYE73268.1 putative sulfatase [Glaesserella parasuis str. Nagasaki]